MCVAPFPNPSPTHTCGYRNCARIHIFTLEAQAHTQYNTNTNTKTKTHKPPSNPQIVHAAAERLQGRLDEHKERCRQLAQERQNIMQQQAQVLRGYVMAGLQLPVRSQLAEAPLMPVSTVIDRAHHVSLGTYEIVLVVHMCCIIGPWAYGITHGLQAPHA